MEAAQVNDEVNLISKTVRFFSFSDYSVQVVVMGVIFMGVGCGLMGGFVVTRKLSLFGDTLSHAVLPGVAVGFLWSQSKNSISIIVGAMIAGFLGVFLISLLKKTTRVCLYSALFFVLSFFYDFAADKQLYDIQGQAHDIIFERITQDIFNETLAKW